MKYVLVSGGVISGIGKGVIGIYIHPTLSIMMSEYFITNLGISLFHRLAFEDNWTEDESLR